MIHPREAQGPAAVAAHYDELDPFYRAIWGEHVHHGYWRTGRESPEEATRALVDLVAERLRLRPGLEVGDVGCGYGATAAILAREHGVAVTGVTLSAVQAAHAVARLDRVRIRVQDWLANDFADGSFDRLLAIESSEHMASKARFFAEAFRTLRPGGRLVVCAWLAREGARPWEVRHLLEPICREGRLPGLGTEGDYRALAEAAGFRVAAVEDISRRVRATWTICLARAALRVVTDPAARRYLRDAGARNRDFSLSLPRLALAYRTGSMRYAVFTFEKG